MHIYHYANYEIAACRKLMGRYGCCEYELDQLLRNEVFVDLYKVVKGGLLIGEPRYSIKNVEHLYRGQRDTEVGNGSDSVVVYENWHELNALGEEGDSWQTSKTLKDIRDYNIDDCNSTQELVEWLRAQQAEHGISYLGKTEVEEPEIPEEVTERTLLRDRLLARSEDGSSQQTLLDENLAWTLEFHRREAKPVFWRLFDRLGMSHHELTDDIDCLACCERTGLEPYKPKPRARLLAYEYQFPAEQEFKIPRNEGMYLLGEDRQKITLDLDECDFERGRLVVKAKQEPEQLISLIPNEYVNPKPIPEAIADVVSRHEQGALGESAIRDFLLRSKPRIKGHSGGSIVSSQSSDERLKEIINAVTQLNNSYLTIQGPPGAGKTYTGKQIIAELLKQGKRIGIASNSHKAINNLLLGVAQFCQQQGIEAHCYCTNKTGDELTEAGIEIVKNNIIADKLKDACVVGTTAWGFCRDELSEQFDYLFIDEAGQVSVANLIGMSRSASNLVLMGDQMQLGQPSQGSHPADSGLSILDYLLYDSPIIAPDMGVFLGTTYRMHPEVNRFISDAIYDGELDAASGNEFQSIEAPEGYAGVLCCEAGVQFVPLEHEGNTQASDEEVAEIKRLANQLLGRRFTSKSGEQRIISWEDMLFVAPYNHQVTKLKQALGEQARVGSVDKFQGQEAPIVFFSLCASDAAESPRGVDFLFDKHRINVAISRAQALVVVVGNPQLFSNSVNSLEQMKKVNVLARLLQYTRSPGSVGV